MIVVKNSSQITFDEKYRGTRYRIEPGAVLSVPDKMAEEWFGVIRQNGDIIHSKEQVGKSAAKYPGISFVFSPKKTVRKKKKEGTCFIRMGGIGDVIMLSASIKKYRDTHPGERIILMTHPMNFELFEYSDHIDEVLSVYDIDMYSFDKVIDLRFAVEPFNICKGKASWYEYTTMDRSDLFDRIVGVKSDKDFPFYVNPACVSMMKRRLQYKPTDTIIGINPCATSIVRSMPLEYVEPLIDELLTNHVSKVVLFGKSDEWGERLRGIHRNFLINLTGQTTLREMIALISLMSVVIAPDTSTTHIAGALGIPCVALFGNIDPKTRVSYYPSVKPFYPVGELACIPCFDRPQDKAYICHDLKGGICMKLMTPKRICERVKEVLNA